MGRLVASLTVFWALVAAPSDLAAQVETPGSSAREVTELAHYESTGLSLLRPYARDKVPVVFVHGLWSGAWSWRPMIEALSRDPAIGDAFQFWTFGYSTGDPIPYSAHLLRRDLGEVRQKLDPGGTDPAFERMVLIGHSMGGLVSKMISVDSGDRLWHVVSKRPFAELVGKEADRTLFHDGLIFGAHPGVRRVIYIATPHRGSRFDRGSIQRHGTRLVRLPDPLRAAHDRLVAENPPDFFSPHFRKAMPTSIDELEWGSPILTGLAEVAHPPTLKVHSIIAERPDSPAEHRTDGLVSFDSAHIPGALSEKIVCAGHLCQDHRDVIAEVRRILAEQAAVH
jgi:pimeloyl-ACP methyl ester carboxylesterase